MTIQTGPDRLPILHTSEALKQFTLHDPTLLSTVIKVYVNLNSGN